MLQQVNRSIRVLRTAKSFAGKPRSYKMCVGARLARDCGATESGLTLVLVDLFVTLLSFDAVLGGRADQQAFQADGLAAVVAPAKAVFLDALKGLFQLRQHALVAIDRVHQPGALFFNRSRVRRVGRSVQAFDGDTVLLNALVGF